MNDATGEYMAVLRLVCGRHSTLRYNLIVTSGKPTQGTLTFDDGEGIALIAVERGGFDGVIERLATAALDWERDERDALDYIPYPQADAEAAAAARALRFATPTCGNPDCLYTPDATVDHCSCCDESNKTRTVTASTDATVTVTLDANGTDETRLDGRDGDRPGWSEHGSTAS